jgi:hypothetical protein
MAQIIHGLTMETMMSDTSVTYLADSVFVFDGTPSHLCEAGPYRTEAFFPYETPYSVIMQAEEWLNAHEIRHQVEIETCHAEQGLVLRIQFPSDDDRRRFVDEFRQI